MSSDVGLQNRLQCAVIVGLLAVRKERASDRPVVAANVLYRTDWSRTHMKRHNEAPSLLLWQRG